MVNKNKSLAFQRVPVITFPLKKVMLASILVKRALIPSLLRIKAVMIKNNLI